MAKDFTNLDTSRAALQMQTALAQEEQDKQEELGTQDTQKKQRKPRKRYTQEEAQQILESGRNARGLGGVKMPRMNMSFTPINRDFIMTLSRARGETFTEFVNDLVDLYREKYKEQYEAAKALLNSF